jgi:hypothetical protein
MRSKRLAAIGLCLLLVGVGCRSRLRSGPPTTTPIKGKVILANGQPLNEAVITFHPKDPPGNEAMAVLKGDGSFALCTFGKEDGAIPGRYVVTVESIDKNVPGRKSNSGRLIPTRYSSEGSSPLVVEVKQDDPDNFMTIRLD